MILGDLFNKPKVDNWVFLQVLEMLFAHCMNNDHGEVILVRGNHDSKSKDRQSICSLEMLASLLGDSVTLVFEKPYAFRDDNKSHYIIPHMFNQEQFDTEISSVDASVDFLYIHANVDNYFAQGDHSLNLSKDQAKTLSDKGVTVICAHEHQARRPFDNVIVIGNQFPTSVADSKGNSEKSFLRIEDGKIERIRTWTNNSYWNVTPDTLDQVPDDAQFVRVNGETNKSDFASVIQKVDQFRKKSNAFVVSNAVKVISEDVTITAEDAANIDVVDLLIKAVQPQFRERVEACVQEE